MTPFSGVSVVFTRSKKGKEVLKKKKKRYDLINHTVACGDDPERKRDAHVLGTAAYRFLYYKRNLCIFFNT
jgi:hypothetical protein